MKRRPCAGPCGLNRAERFFTSERGRICIDCQRRKRKQTSRKNHVTRTYNLTASDHARLLAAQDGRCAICKGTRPYELQVDHDHATGLVRGLLCKPCNKRLLPSARDSVELLCDAANYLVSPPAKRLGIQAVVAE